MKPNRLLHFVFWAILIAEMLFLLLPRTVLDSRVMSFFITAGNQLTHEELDLGMGLLLGMMAVELFSMFTLWWLTLRCMKTTLNELPSYIWIGAALSVVWMVNFMLPILWALVATPLFSTPKQMGMLQAASLIVTATAFAIMYWRGKQLQSNTPPTGSALIEESATLQHWYMPNKKWQRGIFVVLLSVIGVTLLMPATPQAELTLEDAAKQRFSVSVKGVPFDIPVNYHYTEYSYFKKWPRPSRGEIEGTERRKVDFIKVTALLPDMSPYTAENAVEFEKPGWGKKVKILFGQQKYLDLSYIKKLPKMEKSKLPGMLQYEGISKDRDYFVSPDYLVSMWCHNEPSEEGWSPICEVLRSYRYKQRVGNLISPVFHVDYTFSRDYLQQWKEIDAQVEILFDRFAVTAQQN